MIVAKDRNMATQVDLDMAAVAAVTITTRLIEALVAKGVLTEQEGLSIYENAYSNMGSGDDQDRYIALLQGLMPALVANRLATAE